MAQMCYYTRLAKSSLQAAAAGSPGEHNNAAADLDKIPNKIQKTG